MGERAQHRKHVCRHHMQSRHMSGTVYLATDGRTAREIPYPAAQSVNPPLSSRTANAADRTPRTAIANAWQPPIS
eukprot:3575887-Rhodomonas_salina.1